MDCEPRSLDGFPITPPVVPDGAAYDISIETPSLEDVLEEGYLTTGRSPVHLAARAAAQTGAVRCEWHGIVRTLAQREQSIRFWLGIDDDTPLPSAAEVERQFMTYVNSMNPVFRPTWKANIAAIVHGGVSTEYVFLTCYADYTVNEYILGAGPSTLTVAYDTTLRMPSYALYERAHAAGALGDEDKLTAAEFASRLQAIVSAAESSFGTALEGRESIVFLAPMGAHGNVATEAWQAAAQWDLQAEEDGTVNAVRYGVPEGDDEHTQTLANLKTRVTTAAANDNFAGKRIANVSGLAQHYRDIGAYEDITPGDGETTTFTPAQPLPPLSCASGTAVTDPNANRSLVHDCEALLAAKDTLAGTASLNWSVERAITEWDGVTTSGTPLRVTRLELPDKSLSGSVPPELGTLFELTRLDLSSNSLTGALPEELGLLSNLAFIRLAGNSFTGCVPYALRNVADSDLGSVGIPYCEAPDSAVCIQPFPNMRVTNPTLQLKREPFTHATQSWDSRCVSSHAPTYNAQFYTFVNHDASRVNDETVLATMRVNIKMSTRHDDVQLLLLGAQLLEGLEPDAPIVATAEAVDAEAGALRTLEIEEVVPYGAYTIEVRAKNPGDAVFDLTASHAYGPPTFEQDSYTFSAAEDAGTFASVGTVVAVDEGGRAVTYSITSGAAGKFGIDYNLGDIIVTGGLDYETTTTYTLTVEARNPDGRTDTVTVTINVTDVAGR